MTQKNRKLALKINFSLLFFFSFVFFFGACSLNYAREENFEETNPEMIFNNTVFSRFRTNRLSVSLEAGKLEQYKSGNESFASDVSFRTFDKTGAKEAEGTCGLISADTKNENYYLFGNIDLHLIKDKTEILAEYLNFDKHSEQIISGSESQVSIIKDNAKISGVGFSASGLSRSFSFMKNVSGTLETDKK